MSPALTWSALIALLLLDGAFAGWRAVAGRSALIRKDALLWRGTWRGALLAALLGAVPLGLLIADLAVSDARAFAVRSAAWDAAAQRIVVIVAPYAAVVALGFLVRTVPDTSLRSLTSLTLFGPALLLRPLVIIAALAWALAIAPRPTGAVLAAVTLAILLPLRRWCQAAIAR